MASRWEQVKTIVGRAMELPGAERARFVASACAGDVELESEVGALLSGADSEDFLETPPAMPDWDAGTVWIGKQLGSYEIARELPAGGMGRVFEAKRIDGAYENTVAIKILRAGIDTPEGRRRFSAERQIVAALQHPHIAHLIDGGVIDGLPYFVMEYVDGLPIDAYCAKNKLGIAARLKLFVSVCAAVEFAHRQLVVHRDIKLENVLITAEGSPKLLDFGIAKFLSDDPSANTTAVDGIGPYTPSYAAPEQIHGGTITTATDVYSLGCVLYQLLTGVLPFDDRENNQRRLLRALAEDPCPPIAVLSRAPADPQRADETLHGLPPRSVLAAALRGDLDVMLQKALANEPGERYQTVTEFRLDIARHLSGRPIRAYPPSFMYVASKLVRRNPVPLIASSVALIAVIAGVIGVVWQGHVANTMRVRAEMRLNEVQEMAEKIISSKQPGWRNRPQPPYRTT
jgi:serine/threonine protein kinase